LFAPHICGVVLHAHPVRGESHNQRSTTGEVATLQAPRYLNPALGVKNFCRNRFLPKFCQTCPKICQATFADRFCRVASKKWSSLVFLQTLGAIF